MESSPNKNAISLEDLLIGYNGSHKTPVSIAGPLTATLHRGELTCLLGANGVGKSTLLKTLSGFMPPLGGNILVGGKNILSYSSIRLAEIISVVLTEKIVAGNMSVGQLLALGRSPYSGFWGRLSEHDKQVIDQSVECIGIEHLMSRQVGSLSDGERQKAMIAKALVQETPIILLDEPTAFLDYPSKVDIMVLLQKLAHSENRAIFISTHDLEIALQIADTVWLLDKEHGLETGTPRNLAISGKIGAYFNRDCMKFDPETGKFNIL